MNGGEHESMLDDVVDVDGCEMRLELSLAAEHVQSCGVKLVSDATRPIARRKKLRHSHTGVAIQSRLVAHTGGRNSGVSGIH